MMRAAHALAVTLGLLVVVGLAGQTLPATGEAKGGASGKAVVEQGAVEKAPAEKGPAEKPTTPRGPNERRQELDEKEKQLLEREAQLRALEKSIEEKLQQLARRRAELEQVVKGREEKREAEIGRLVRVYEGMKPEGAARLVERLDAQVVLELFTRMKETKVAKILALVEPTRAVRISEELARRKGR
ncbi:MAG: hypothetical protein HYV08_15125 [Deltaproteobacteria bacterium]|nr:hypothetical protein [Deltaproteobacteria bacterium]